MLCQAFGEIRLPANIETCIPSLSVKSEGIVLSLSTGKGHSVWLYFQVREVLSLAADL